MGERTIEYMLVSGLDPHPENPKAHDVETLQASLARFGFVEPVVLDERTARLLSGHGRVETLIAAEQAGLDAPDGIDVDDNGWWVPVVRGVTTKDDAEADALVVALNAVGEGLWHEERLDKIVAALHDGPGLAGVGISDDRVASLLAAQQTSSERGSPFADFGEQNKPDTVDFRFGDYSGKLARPLYESFVEAVEKRRESSGAVLLDDVLAGWLSL